MAACVQEHPFLSVGIKHPESSNPEFFRLDHVNLRNHFRVIRNGDDLVDDTDADEMIQLKAAFETIHNEPEYAFTDVDTKPAWAIDVLELPSVPNSHVQRVFISFTYSHTHGDGMSGVAFHRSFLRAMKASLSTMAECLDVIEAPQYSLNDHSDISLKMPISWSYLLLPVIGEYLPGILTKAIGIPTDISGCDEKTFTGATMFLEIDDISVKAVTKADIIHIDSDTLKRILVSCKERGAKLSSLINALVSRAMSLAFQTTGDHDELNTNFVAQTPINLRTAAGIDANTIGNYASGSYSQHKFAPESTPLDEASWDTIKSQGQALAKAASSLQDQPTGLLRYVSDIRAWLQGKIGQTRDCSWELSNLGAVGFDTNAESGGVTIEQMVFSQCASPIGPPVNFSTISLRNGSLEIVVSWQNGSLGLGDSETPIMQAIIKSVKEQLYMIGGVERQIELL